MNEAFERAVRAMRTGRKCAELPPQVHRCPNCNRAKNEATDGLEGAGCVWLVRAVIEALREPTKTMLKAPPAPEDRRSMNLKGTRGTVDDFLDNWTAKAVWHAMIDEALRE